MAARLDGLQEQVEGLAARLETLAATWQPPADDRRQPPAATRQRKLTPRQVRALRDKHQHGVPVPALIEEYGLARASVFRDCRVTNARATLRHGRGWRGCARTSRTNAPRKKYRMANRQLWTGMTQWELMVHVDSDHHTAQYHGFAPDWPCPHCRTSLTVLTCTYTPNRFATEEQPYQAGDLCCPHCATSVARAYVRRLFCGTRSA